MLLYVLDLGLSYTDIHELTQTMKEQKISEEQVSLSRRLCISSTKVRTIVVCFLPSFVKCYKLDWVYDSEPHKATQVFLSKDSSREVPIEDCTYLNVVRTGGI